jgi:hypothetical protein
MVSFYRGKWHSRFKSRPSHYCDVPLRQYVLCALCGSSAECSTVSEPYSRLRHLYVIIGTSLSLWLTDMALSHDNLWRSLGIAPYFLISALFGCQWSASRPGRFNSVKTRYPFDRRLGSPQILSWRYGEEKYLAMLGLELRSFGCLARSPWLYQLHYPGSLSRTLLVFILTCDENKISMSQILLFSQNSCSLGSPLEDTEWF